MTDLQTAVLKWLTNGRTGLSSETLAFWAAFGLKKDRASHPHDPADFNRCLMLLKAAPALREKLPEMRSISPEWELLVARWSDIETSFLEEVGLDWCNGHKAPLTYQLMKEVMDPKAKVKRAAVVA